MSIRKISITSIIERKRESNNKSIYACKSLYSKNGIYNYERELILQIILFVLTILAL